MPMKTEEKSQFKVIILAAGYGRRMRPLTYHTHKTLLKIGQKTVIQRIIDSLLQCQINDICIVTGYQETELKLYLEKTYPDLKFTYVLNSRYKETNNIYSLGLAFEKIEINKNIILIEADLIFDSSILNKLLQSSHDNVALVDHYHSGMDGTVITIDPEKNTVNNIIPPHLQGSKFDFSDKYKTLNIYKFSQNFCRHEFGKLLQYYANVWDDNCYYELILGLIIYLGKAEIVAEIIDKKDKWAEIDDPNDLRIAEFIFNQNIQKEIIDSSYGGFWNYNILDYCFIRNMYFPTSAVLTEIRNNLPVLLQNYGSTQKILEQKLATYLYCQAKNLIALNGCSQIYPILQQYLQKKKILLPLPTFGEYTRIFSDFQVYYDQVGLNKAEISDKIQDCDAIVIVNPNNPTGSIISTEWIYNLAVSHPDKLVIVDESFIQFSQEETILNLLEKKPLSNIILLVSLSKTLGIPGMRLGYVYSNNNNFNSYVRHRLPIWNLNSITEYFLEIILKHRDSIEESYEKTKSDRQNFIKQLESLPRVKQVYPSGGNFLLVELDCEANFVDNLTENLLTKYKIYAKNVSNKFDNRKSCLRLAVRNEADNLKLIVNLKQVINEYE